MPPNTLTVRAGSTYYNRGGQVMQVAEIHDHPEFVRGELDFAVSVLILTEDIILGDSARIINLAHIDEDVETGTLGIITGWGTFEAFGPFSENLRTVLVPKYDQNECIRLYNGDVTPRMTCYGYLDPPTGVGHGDFGAPLEVNGKLFGIASWAIGHDDTPILPTVYTKISHPEIHNHINSVLSLP